MTSQGFLWTNLGLALVVVIIFLIGKKGMTAPTRLNLRRGFNGFRSMVEADGDSPIEVTIEDDAHTRASRKNHKTRDQSADKNMKNLNVIFMYNGHHFDAYEVLGLPAGARLEIVQNAYQSAIAMKGSDREFLDAAFGAIKTARNAE